MNDWTPSTVEAAREYLRGGAPAPFDDTAKTTSEVDALAQAVKDFAGRTRPGVRDMVIADDVKATQAKWLVDDTDCLSADYLERLHAKKAAVYDAETKALDQEIAPRFNPLREALGQKLAEARGLRLESERINPNANEASQAAYLTARMLDELATDRAEKWLKEHEDDQEAILERYRKSHDRRDVHFLALVESKFGLTDEAPSVTGAFTPPLRAAVRERQDKRIPESLRTALATLNAAEDNYIKSRASAFPSDATISKALGAVLRRAK